MKLTRAQLDGLIRIRNGGSMMWAHGIRSRAGGATARMFERMVTMGLCTGPPFEITDAGMTLLGTSRPNECHPAGAQHDPEA